MPPDRSAGCVCDAKKRGTDGLAELTGPDLFRRFERARTHAGGPGHERHFEELRADKRAAWEAVAANYGTEEDR